ncbi:MAG TPA: hypothetical protein VEK79_04015 [Thermoanaerobaculia bacterium]|nr:hypothetical protein [Thermoanaerobaculia bacterium]
MLTASVLLSVALTLRPDSGLRLVNPHPVPVDTKLVCGDFIRELRLEPEAVHDVAVTGLCTSPQLESTLPLLTLETGGETEQRFESEDTSCPSVTMSAPLFACERGVATASVPPVEDATYSWLAENALIATGANTNKVTVNLGATATAKLTCVITRNDGCSTEAVGIIAIRKPLVIHELNVPVEAEAAKPLTITWSYAGDVVPGAQLLMGDAFAQPVLLSPEKRTYTFTPAAGGTRNVELVASLAPTIKPPVAPKGKRRAVGSTLATATQCPSAKMVKKVELRGCTLGTPQILMPEIVESGSSFVASVEVLAIDSVSWSVTNGTLLTPDYLPQVEVRANDDEKPMRVNVTITRGTTCAASASLDLVVKSRASCATAPPTAALSVASQTCDKATIQVMFTGTPPFRGMWHDQTTFETSSTSITKEVSSLGTFTILNFRDALCSGIVTRNARVDSVKPTVTLTSSGGECATPDTKVVATFTGMPPFEGEWNDGVKFVTNEYQIERAATTPWPWYLHALRDARCQNVAEHSNFLNIVEPTTVDVEEETACQYGDQALAYIRVNLYGGEPPFTIEWNDGVITTTHDRGSAIRPVNISVPLAEYRVVRATAKRCNQLDIRNDTGRVALRPPVQIDRDASDIVLCATNIGTAKLAAGLTGNPAIAWSIEGGTILSGQGTSEITFQGVEGTDAKLSVRTTHEDGACDAFDQTLVYVMGEPEISDFKAAHSTIKAGGFTTLTFSWERDVEFVSLDTSSSARYDDLVQSGFSCVDRKCSIPYHDTKGPGTVTIFAFYGGPCNYSPGKQTSVTLTIEP